MRGFLFSLLFFLHTLPVMAAGEVSASNVVLNAYLSLKAEMSAVRGGEQDLASAVARSQSQFWDYERITRSAVDDQWLQVAASERKWELVSAVGRYLNHALSRLMGSDHPLADVKIGDESLDETGEVSGELGDVPLLPLRPQIDRVRQLIGPGPADRQWPSCVPLPFVTYRALGARASTPVRR